MTNEELKRLDAKLTKSDSKAKPGYVRCKTGYLPEDQGFSPLDNLPVFNTIRDTETKLAEFIEDVATLNESHKKLQDSHTLLRNEYEGFVRLANQREQQLQKEIDKLNAVELSELRIVIASLADRLQKLEDETDII